MTEAVQENLLHWLSAQPDLTENELRDRLAASGVVVSKSCIGKVLRKMGMRRKKNRPMPSSETLRPTSNADKSSSSRSARLRRKS